MILQKKYIAIIGDSHAHTSYPGFAQEFKKRGYETVLFANSSCPPYREAMGKNLKDIERCQKKVADIYRFIEKMPNLEKVILATRGPVYMYAIDYGVVGSGGSRPLTYHFYEFFTNKISYNQKEKFFQVVKDTFRYFYKRKNLELYFLLENPKS